MFTITGFHYSTEIDSFEEGCIGVGSDSFFDYAMKDATIDGLKAKIADFVGCTVGDLELDACEDIGRIEGGRTENVDGDIASDSELAAWRKGEVTLYYAVYTCYVIQCLPASVA